MTDTAYTSTLSDTELHAGSGANSLVDVAQVAPWLERIRSCGVLNLVAAWRDADRAASGKRPGGRTSLISDEVILVISLLLTLEGSKVQPHEMGRMLEFRLTEGARNLLNIADLYDGTARDWMHLSWRAVHRLIDTWDGWPAKRHTLSHQERVDIETNRDEDRIAECRSRGEKFTSLLIEMGLELLPKHLQKDTLALSVDQSSIRAGSQLRRWRKKNGIEQPKWNKNTGEEHPKMVLELEADLYPVKKGVQYKDRDTAEANNVRQEYEMAFMANLIIDVAENPESGDNGLQLIRAASLGTPNRRIGDHTLALLDLILERGHTISRLTFDRGYNYLNGFHEALLARGIDKVQDYITHQRGITNGVGGAKFVEGRFYCYGTPQQLLDATKHVNRKHDHPEHIDDATYIKRLNERERYELHLKEGPDAKGTIKLRCPALGPSATVECPLREMHAKAVVSKDRAVVSAKNTPKGDELPRVCCQTSISIKKDVSVQERQKLRYGSKEWFKTYRADRNSMESMNWMLKKVIGLEDTSRRGMRGLAAQQFILALHVVAANHKRITDHAQKTRKQELRTAGPSTITRKRADEKLQRRRDRLGLSRYKRNPEPLELIDPPTDND